MVAEAQRNVIISLKLAADPKNQATADRVSRQAQNVSRAGVNAVRQGAGEHARIEAGRTTTHANESNKRVDKALKEQDKRAKAAKDLSDKIKSAEKVRTESHQRANEVGLIAVQGMADMVEGAAKLGLVTEENFETFDRHFVMIQSGMQVFKGATDMWWKGREVLISLSAATNTQTTANNLMAVSNRRLAISNVTAGASGGAGRATAGVAGQAVAGATGAGVGNALGTGSVIRGAGIAAVLAGEITVMAAASLAVVEIVRGIGRALGDTSDSAESPTLAVLGWWEASNKAAEGTKNLTKAEEKRQKRLSEMQKFAERSATRAGLIDDLRTTGDRATNANAVVSRFDPRQTADLQRLQALQAVRSAEKEIIAERILNEKRLAAGRFTSEENILRVRKKLEQAQGRLLDAELQRLSVIRDQNKATKDQLRSAEERLDAERAGVAGRNAQFDRLSPFAKTRASDIANRKLAGEELSKSDLRFLEQKRLATGFTEQIRSKAGAAAGGTKFQAAFGQLDNLNKAQLDVAGLSKNLQAGKQQELLIKQFVSPAAAALKKATEERIKAEAELKNIVLETIQGLKKLALQPQGANVPGAAGVKAIQQAGADNSDSFSQEAMNVVGALNGLGISVLTGFSNMEKAANDTNQLINSYKGLFGK